MKWTSWKTALVCGVALSMSSAGLLADSKDGDKGGGRSQAGGGGNRGGDKPQSGGGGRSQPGGAQPSRGGSAPQSGGRGGIHAPPVAAPRQQPSERGGQPPSNRTPSFSLPNTGRQPGVTTPPPVTVRPGSGARIGNNSNDNTHGDGQSGAIRRGDQGLRGNVDVGAQTRRSDISRSRIGNQPFVVVTAGL